MINGIKDKPVVIASDMRVDSGGHSGLLGSESTLAVKQNVILDIQVVKVIAWRVHNMCNVQLRQCVIMVKHHTRH